MTTNNDLAEQIEPSVRAHIVAIRTTAAVERAFAATSTAAGGSAQQRTKVANATAMAAPAPRRAGESWRWQRHSTRPGAGARARVDQNHVWRKARYWPCFAVKRGAAEVLDMPTPI